MTHLDGVMPRWQFRERHSIRVAATPESIFAAIRQVTAREIFLFRAVTFIAFGAPEILVLIAANAPQHGSDAA